MLYQALYVVLMVAEFYITSRDKGELFDKQFHSFQLFTLYGNSSS